MAERHFTPQEANELLPQVRTLAERMVAHRRSLAIATARHARVAAKISGNGGGVNPHEVDQLRSTVDAEANAVAACVDELSALGVQVKDLDEGLVDFPCRHGDREVLLCWRLGEDEVVYWHEADEGFAGRKSLPIE